MADVLLIDDDAELRTVLRLNLETFGHRVTEAGGGHEALKLFRSFGADVVVTDLFMAEKDGFEVISEMKQKWPGLPIIAMSGGGRVAPGINLGIAAHLGAKRVLEKPFSVAELNKAVISLAPGPEPSRHPIYSEGGKVAPRP